MLDYDQIQVGDLVCLIYRYHYSHAERVVKVTWKGNTHLTYELEEFNVGTRQNPKFVKPSVAKNMGKKGIHSKGMLRVSSWKLNLGKDSFII